MENWKSFWENGRRGPVHCSKYISNESQHSVNCMIVWELQTGSHTHIQSHMHTEQIQMSMLVNTGAKLCKFTHGRYWSAKYRLNYENVFVFVFTKLYFHPNIVVKLGFSNAICRYQLCYCNSNRMSDKNQYLRVWLYSFRIFGWIFCWFPQNVFELGIHSMKCTQLFLFITMLPACFWVRMYE